jgi:hypothetical protein
MSTQSFMGPLPSDAFGADVGGCKRRTFAGSMQSTSERPCPSSIACGGGMHTGMVLEDLEQYQLKRMLGCLVIFIYF